MARYRKIADADKIYRSFSEARLFVRNLRLKGVSEWRRYAKGELIGYTEKPSDIPSGPDRTYKNDGWTCWPDWFGTNKVPYAEAQQFAKKLGLKRAGEWRQYCKEGIEGKPIKPRAIPLKPARHYMGKGWIDWPDFLGYEPKKKKEK